MRSRSTECFMLLRQEKATCLFSPPLLYSSIITRHDPTLLPCPSPQKKPSSALITTPTHTLALLTVLPLQCHLHYSSSPPRIFQNPFPYNIRKTFDILLCLIYSPTVFHTLSPCIFCVLQRWCTTAEISRIKMTALNKLSENTFREVKERKVRSPGRTTAGVAPAGTLSPLACDAAVLSVPDMAVCWKTLRWDLSGRDNIWLSALSKGK